MSASVITRKPLYYAVIVVGFDQSLYQIEQGVVPVTLTIRINLIGQLRRDIQVRFLTRQHSAIGQYKYLAPIKTANEAAIMY